LDVMVYPNPASDVVVVELPDHLLGSTVIELYDVYGRLVHRESATTSLVTLSINVPSGVYRVQGVREFDVVFSKQLVVN
jgi:hypothetical protein